MTVDGLAQFLAERYGEAEAKARALDGREWEYRDSWIWSGSTEIADVFNIPDPDDAGTFIADVDPAHRLADIALKRAILAAYEAEYNGGFAGSGFTEGLEFAVRQLGTEFAEHPAYKPEWRPE